MTMGYVSTEEEALHRHAMERLAQQTGRSLAEIEVLWADRFAELACDARVRQYLPIFIGRAVLAALAAPGESAQPAAAGLRDEPPLRSVPRRPVHRLRRRPQQAGGAALSP